MQVWIFIELLFVIFLYVEMREPTFEEIAKTFDGDDAQVVHLDIEKVEAAVMTSGFEMLGGSHLSILLHA